MSKVWTITGTSKGFGRIFAEAALKRGDRVAATARDPASVADLVERFGEENALPIALDVSRESGTGGHLGAAFLHPKRTEGSAVGWRILRARSRASIRRLRGLSV